MSAYKNSLAGEKSPYLQQHASNPVAWHPWGDEAFASAAAADKPIFLSIGYSTCHWCHVMERESFEDRETAAFLNRHFISVKVDREERPDIDKIYMDVVVATTGSGGWPLSLFLTPEGKPIYGGTYFPRESRWGMPGFLDVAASIVEAWTTQRERVLSSAEGIVGHVINRETAPERDAIAPTLLSEAYRQLCTTYDPLHGGFGRAPKFPAPHTLRFLLSYHSQHPGSQALEMVKNTLIKMGLGGIFDQLGGGFHRYSVDPRWRVPHFEKMLYDQAGLVSVCTEAWQMTGEPCLADTVRRTLEYVRRDMLAPEGVFYAAEDADSYADNEQRDKKEGAFYLWRRDELEKALTPQEFVCVHSAYGIRANGNIDEDPHGEFTGMNILHTEKMTDDPLLTEAKTKLLALRSRRHRPHRDNKTLASWNGMMISAYAQAAAAFGVPEYTAIAKNAADFIIDRMMDNRYTLRRRYIDGDAAIDGGLDDYAFVCAALLDLYQVDFSIRYLDVARSLTERMTELFWDSENSGFYATAQPAIHFARRQRVPEDNATPSACSVATASLFRLARILREPKYERLAVRQIDSVASRITSCPTAYASTLAALGFKFGAAREFILIEGRNPEPAQRVERMLKSRSTPCSVVVKRPCTLDNQSIELQLMPWLKDMDAGAHAVVLHICENGRCRLPAEGEAAATRALDNLSM